MLPPPSPDLPGSWSDLRPLPAVVNSAAVAGLMSSEGPTNYWLLRVYNAYMEWMKCSTSPTPEPRQLPVGW